MSGIRGNAATNTDEILNTVKISTAMRGDTQIRFSLTGAATDQENVHIKEAAWRATPSRKGVTFAGKDWTDQAEFVRYFNNFGTQVVSMKIVTDDVDNFNGELIFTEKSPTGKEVVITKDLSRYKVESAKSDGYSDTVIIDDIPFPLGPNTDVQISEIKANSKIKFFFNIDGQTKTMELVPIRTDSF